MANMDAVEFDFPNAAGVEGEILAANENGDARWISPSGVAYVKVSKTFTDFSAAGLTKTLTIFTAAAREVIESVIMVTKTAFIAVDLTTVLVSVGDAQTADPESLIEEADMVAAGAKAASSGVPDVTILKMGGTNVVSAHMAAEVNLDTLSAGEITFYIKKQVLPAP